MSFPRAQVKRFNEQQGCAPPPGHYNMPELKPEGGAMSFETGGQRFKQEADDQQLTAELSEQISAQFTVPTNVKLSTSKKRLNFAAPATNVKAKSASNRSTPLPSPGLCNKEKQSYEKEIRRLLQQVNEQDKTLQSKMQEVQKLESKLNILTKDKSGLVAQVATAEKKFADMQTKNLLLKAQSEKQQKREDTEAELKKTKQKLEIAKQELDKCRSLLVALQSDLEAARSTIAALQQSNEVLTQLNKEVQDHSDDVSNQVAKLQDLADTLRSEKLVTEEELALARKKLQMADQDFTTILKGKIQEIEGKLAEKQQAFDHQLQNAESKLKDSVDQLNDLKKTLSRVEDDKKCLMQENNELNSKVKQLSDDHMQHVESVRDSGKELSETKDMLCKSEEEKAQLKEQIAQLGRELELAKEERNCEAANLSEKLRTLQEQHDSNISKSSDLQNRLEDVAHEKAELAAEINEASRKNELLEQEVAQSKDELKMASTETAALKSALNEAESQLDTRSVKMEKLIEENATLSEEHEALKREANEFREQLLLLEAKADALETQLMKSEESASDASERGEAANQKTAKLEQTLKQKEDEYQAKLNEFTRRLLEMQRKLNNKQDEMQSLVRAQEVEDDKMRAVKKDNEQQAKQLADADKMYGENAALLSRVRELEEKVSSLADKEKEGATRNNAEIEKWKSLYNNLQEKIKPFKGQIDAYAAEKAALLSENTAAHTEMQELGKKYAELLGHQNHKQKIKHVVKIKEENIGLKQELGKLRTQVAKLQKQALANRAAKFNPSEAFQNKKENSTPLTHNN